MRQGVSSELTIHAYALDFILSVHHFYEFDYMCQIMEFNSPIINLQYLVKDT